MIPKTGEFLDNIPERLRTLDQWMGTRFELRGKDKLDKPPYRVRRGLSVIKADKRDPEVWATFEDASKALHEGLVNAIGIVFTGSDPFGCTDLDDCRKESSGIEHWARICVETLPTYWEISISGNGLHGVFEGKKPGERCRRGAIEIYDRQRFLVVTGRHLEGTPTDVRPCQESVDTLYRTTFGMEDPQPSGDPLLPGSTLEDREIPKRIMQSRHGEKFARLWRGVLGSYESHSNADLALCGILAFWTGGDQAQIERLFSQSGLCRPKWTKRPDYRERTIKKALAGKTEFYTPQATLRSGKRRKGKVYARKEAVIRDA